MRGETICENSAHAPGARGARTKFDRAAAVRRGALLELMSESALREADLALAEAEILKLAEHQRLGLLRIV